MVNIVVNMQRRQIQHKHIINSSNLRVVLSRRESEGQKGWSKDRHRVRKRKNRVVKYGDSKTTIMWGDIKGKTKMEERKKKTRDR